MGHSKAIPAKNSFRIMTSTIDRQHWQAVKAILADALGHDPAERDAFLDKACQGNAALRNEVADLLALEGGESERLETPAVNEFLAYSHSALIGTYVDRYKILDELGSGGMGAVFLAERDE